MTRTQSHQARGGATEARGRARNPLEEIRGECLGVRARLLSRTLTRIYDAALRPQGLTAAQLNLLAVIGSLEQGRAGEVANVLSMEISTLSRNAHLMQREGWVTIEPAEHGNGRLLSLTSAGVRKLENANPAWRRAQEEAIGLLGEDGAELVRQLVDGIWAEQTRASPAHDS